MATIKLQNDKVILKDGKVSCSCCGEPSGECCMYPAQALADGLYSSSDLPDAISGGDYVRSGTTFFGPPNSFNVELIIGQNGFAEWAAARNYANPPFFDIGFVGPECTSRCLITLEQDLGQFCYSHEDQFADAYTVTTFSGTGTVTRISLCTWEGVDEDGCGLLLFYSGGDPPIGSNDLVAINKWGLIFGIFDQGLGYCESFDIAEKENPQNSPTGQYFSVDSPNPNAVATIS